MAPRQSLTLLHLSDLQFGRAHLFEKEGVEGDQAYDTLFERLKIDLVELRDSHRLEPDVIVVTGDLAEWGKRVEFEQVASLAAKLQDLYGLERRRVLVIPGNHDINRKKCEGYFNDREAEDLEPEKPYWPKWYFYHEFFAKFYAGIDDYTFDEDHPYTLFKLPKLGLIVAGLNSTMAESHQESDHFGLVGKRQLQWFADRLPHHRDWLRVAAVHHNVIRGETRDDENLRDAEAMQRILGPHLHLVMHGHRHRAGVHWWGPKLPIFAAGSASVAPEARVDETPNQYQFIRVERDRLHWFTRMYARDTKRFVADTRHSSDGNSWQHNEDLSFDVMPPDPPSPSRSARGRRTPMSLADYEDRRSPPGRDGLVERMLPIVRARESDVIEIRDLPASDLGDRYLRLTVRTPVDTFQSLLLAVVDGPLTPARLTTFLRRVVDRYRADGSHPRFDIICSEPAEPEALQMANREQIRVRTVAEYQGLPELRPVVQQMLERLDRGDLHQAYASSLYVPQRMTARRGGEAIDTSDALACVRGWLETTDGVLALILGEFGTGKTFLLRELARTLGRAYLDGHGALIPLLIEMGQLDRSHGLQDLLGQTLLRAGVQRVDVAVFRHLVEQGQIVLLFDGSTSCCCVSHTHGRPIISTPCSARRPVRPRCSSAVEPSTSCATSRPRSCSNARVRAVIARTWRGCRGSTSIRSSVSCSTNSATRVRPSWR